MNSLDLWENIVRGSITGKYLGLVLNGKYPYSGKLEYNSIDNLYNSKERVEAENRAFSLFTQILDELLGTEGIAPRPVAEMEFDRQEDLDNTILSAQLIQGLKWVTDINKELNSYCITFTFDLESNDPNVTPAECYRWLYHNSVWGKEKREVEKLAADAEQQLVSKITGALSLDDDVYKDTPVAKNLLDIIKHHKGRAFTKDMTLTVGIEDLEFCMYALQYISKNFFPVNVEAVDDGATDVREETLLKHIDFLHDDDHYTSLMESGVPVHLGDEVAYPLSHNTIRWSIPDYPAWKEVKLNLNFSGKIENFSK